jgi:hypothetical protein
MQSSIRRRQQAERAARISKHNASVRTMSRWLGQYAPACGALIELGVDLEQAIIVFGQR